MDSSLSPAPMSGNRLFMNLLALVAVLLSVFLGFKAYQTWRMAQEVGQPIPYEPSISI